jgi:hypothetical protein
MLVTIIARRGQAPSKRTPPSDGDKPRRNEHRLKGEQETKRSPRGSPKRPPRGSPAWSLDRNQNANPYTTPPPRGLTTWSDDQIVHATIRSASDRDKPRRDGELARLACWSRLSSDGDNPVETNTASREIKTLAWGHSILPPNSDQGEFTHHWTATSCPHDLFDSKMLVFYLWFYDSLIL